MESFIIFSLGIFFLILTIIEEGNHPQIPLVHEMKKCHWLERGIFTSSH
jgi:hypothetical protein